MTTQENLDEALRRLIDVYDPLMIYFLDEPSEETFVIVVEGSWQKPHKRSIAGRYALWGLTIPKDIIVFTQNEFQERTHDVTNLVYRVRQEGKLLYARA